MIATKVRCYCTVQYESTKVLSKVRKYFRTKVVIYLLYLRTTTTTVQATKIDTKVLSYFEGTFVKRCTVHVQYGSAEVLS